MPHVYFEAQDDKFSLERLAAALRAIRDMPIPEQDNMLSASVRKIAAEALEPAQLITPI